MCFLVMLLVDFGWCCFSYVALCVYRCIVGVLLDFVVWGGLLLLTLLVGCDYCFCLLVKLCCVVGLTLRFWLVVLL